ncbi:MAG: carbohydrate-binding family 9-like protein [Tannerellaceae bacterium]|nr:carbohydrate-binding family 9-like protein [Tannerellaceae bacterium]
MKARINKLSSVIVLSTTLLFCSCRTNEEIKTMDFNPVPLFNPPSYICYKAPSTITIDGKLSPGEWDTIPWTDDFTDIEGDKRPAPFYQTRAKMAWNKEGMFFAVLMEEPHVWGTITEHDAVIYHDNDFEIFLNPSNDTHNYLEFEINALGTVWDLYLSKPYRDPNHTILDNFEFAGMKTAVYVDGTINNPKDTDKSWSVEVFIPWKSIYEVMRGKDRPVAGEHMRVNFSRVQWTTEVQNGKYVKVPIGGESSIREYNWVWAPTGVINIHLPEFWGYVQFSDKIAGTGTDEFSKNPDEDIKWALRNLYYRQQQYLSEYGKYADNILALKPEEVCGNELAGKAKLYNTLSMYEITLPSPTGKTWHIREDGLVWSH